MHINKFTFETGIQVLLASVGIQANRKALLPQFPLAVEVKSLLTDFKEMVKIPYAKELDGQVLLEDNQGEEIFYKLLDGQALFTGPLLRLEQEASDLRYSLWGNQGFLYRYILFLLEEKHRIYSFHACGLYSKKEHQLYVIAGGAGSGKTVYLLSGLLRGLKLFSTETVHFRLEGSRVIWFMGSLADNVRRGTLRHNFPQFLPKKDFPCPESEEWQKKIALDLSSYKHPDDTLTNPGVMLLFPRIEEGRKGFFLYHAEDKRIGAKAIFDNLSQKISETVVLYDKMIIPGLDNHILAQARLKAAYRLIGHPSLIQIASVLSNPDECWGNLLN